MYIICHASRDGIDVLWIVQKVLSSQGTVQYLYCISTVYSKLRKMSCSTLSIGAG